MKHEIINHFLSKSACSEDIFISTGIFCDALGLNKNGVVHLIKSKFAVWLCSSRSLCCRHIFRFSLHLSSSLFGILIHSYTSLRVDHDQTRTEFAAYCNTKQKAHLPRIRNEIVSCIIRRISSSQDGSV